MLKITSLCQPGSFYCILNFTPFSRDKDLVYMVFNATFNNISVISWWSVLLLEETGVSGEHHRPVASLWKTLSQNVVHLAITRFEVTTLVVICTDYTGSFKSNYYTITNPMSPPRHKGILNSTENRNSDKRFIDPCFYTIDDLDKIPVE